MFHAAWRWVAVFHAARRGAGSRLHAGGAGSRVPCGAAGSRAASITQRDLPKVTLALVISFKMFYLA
jgi:hypothetical protein